MGCGKSSVGRELSRLLCCPFMDLDAVIEEAEGRTIPEIFATDGEASFRAMEAETLRDIISHCGQGRLPKQSLPSQAMGPSLCGQRGSTVSVTSPDHSHTAECHPERSEGSVDLVLALGGGTVMTPRCAELVHENTLCIYLSASIDTLVSHLEHEAAGRPLLDIDNCHSDQAKRVEKSAMRERITSLMSRRSATYENTAHVIIDTDGKSIEAIASEIVSLLG